MAPSAEVSAGCEGFVRSLRAGTWACIRRHSGSDVSLQLPPSACGVPCGPLCIQGVAARRHIGRACRSRPSGSRDKALVGRIQLQAPTLRRDAEKPAALCIRGTGLKSMKHSCRSQLRCCVLSVSVPHRATEWSRALSATSVIDHPAVTDVTGAYEARPVRACRARPRRSRRFQVSALISCPSRPDPFQCSDLSQCPGNQAAKRSGMGERAFAGCSRDGDAAASARGECVFQCKRMHDGRSNCPRSENVG
jgi:hypothetical protein